ncbi:hypothetical protein [Glycomyces sp. NPDC047010]|uniref:hypothetical protein n=1 Tax=Glycomyces sp. NPDC047010 TaxID=3155023 RepID=UPI0033C4FB52
MHVGRPLIRGFRALVFAVACTGVTAVLHFAAGGHVFAPGHLAVAVAAVTAAAVPLGSRQRGPVALVAACTAAQAVLHVWFTLASGHLEHLDPGAAMTGVHLLAAAATALWLARGDAALAALADLLTLFAAPALALLVAAVPAVPVRTVPVHAAPRPRPRLFAAAAPRRGPPLGALAA